MNEALLPLMTGLIEDTDELVMGFNLDPKRRSLYLDYSLVAREGSNFAKTIATARATKGALAGLVQKDAAFYVHRAAKLSKEEMQFWDAAMKNGINEQRKRLDAEDLGDGKKPAEKLVAWAEKLFAGSQAEGEVEWGLAVRGEGDALLVLAGIRLGNAREVERDLPAMIEQIVGEEADRVKYELKLETYHGFSINRMQSLQDKSQPPSYFAFGDKFLLLAFGKNGLPELKKFIDSTADGGGAAVPFQMAVSLSRSVKPLLAEAPESEYTRNIERKLEALKDKDRIIVKLSATGANAISGRLEIEEAGLAITSDLTMMAVEWFQQQDFNFPIPPLGENP
jgi:hypothetical protein